MSSTAQAVQRNPEMPEWLRRIVQDNSEPPRLYAWTPANVTNEAVRRDVARSNPQSTDRIYVLGVGNLGRLFATGLGKLPFNRPPITLVVHRKGLLEQWMSSPGVEIERLGVLERNADFDVEWWTEENPATGPVLEPGEGLGIGNLIVATKASDALPQVDRLRRYLTSESTVVFTQNGMCKLWPPLCELYTNHRFRLPGNQGPNWAACVTTHGVTSSGPFQSVHASLGTVSVGPVSLHLQNGHLAESLMRKIADAPTLHGKKVERPVLWILQLEKLVVNSVINPLTAILHCKNGELLVDRNDALPAIIDLLIKEASGVLKSLVMDSSSAEILEEMNVDKPSSYPVLDYTSDCPIQGVLLERFEFPNLRAMVLDVGYKVRENTSSSK
jgi:2-dehydropantoate 2-reductase